MAGQNAVTEAGGETLDLSFDRRGHIDGAAVGDVAVGPAGMVMPAASPFGPDPTTTASYSAIKTDFSCAHWVMLCARHTGKYNVL